MLPAKIKRSRIDPADEPGTSYKRPEKIDTDGNDERLLDERLAGQHEMMTGESADLELLDRTSKKDWPEIHCLDD